MSESSKNSEETSMAEPSTDTGTSTEVTGSESTHSFIPEIETEDSRTTSKFTTVDLDITQAVTESFALMQIDSSSGRNALLEVTWPEQKAQTDHHHVFLIRCAERADRLFPQWLSDSFTDDHRYLPTNLASLF